MSATRVDEPIPGPPSPGVGPRGHVLRIALRVLRDAQEIASLAWAGDTQATADLAQQLARRCMQLERLSRG